MRDKINFLLLCLGCCPFTLTQTEGAGESNTDLKGDQPAHVRAAIGSSVTLSCSFIYVGGTNETRLGKFYTPKHWDTMNDAENVECKPHVSKQGRLYCNFSSTITKIRPENEAVYYCEVWIPRSKGTVTVKGRGTEVSLYSEGSSIGIQPPSQLVSGREAVLTCKASGFYPRNVSVLWFHREAPVARGSLEDDITEGRDGTFSLRSHYRFRAVAADHAAHCRCQVSHPAWPHERSASIKLAVGYGPSAVNVSSRSTVVTHGSVRLPVGSPFSLTCSADGNPSPETWWLRGDTGAQHVGGTLQLASVQEEHGGTYWCVAQNQFGEKNTSIFLLVSQSRAQADGLDLMAFCGLGVILIILVLGAIICLLTKRKNMSQAQKPTAVCTADESQLIYAEIIFPLASRCQDMTKVADSPIYSTVLRRDMDTQSDSRRKGPAGTMSQRLRPEYVLT